MTFQQIWWKNEKISNKSDDEGFLIFKECWSWARRRGRTGISWKIWQYAFVQVFYENSAPRGTFLLRLWRVSSTWKCSNCLDEIKIDFSFIEIYFFMIGQMHFLPSVKWEHKSYIINISFLLQFLCSTSSLSYSFQMAFLEDFVEEIVYWVLLRIIGCKKAFHTVFRNKSVLDF